jgi:hypothetical protein
LDFSLKWPAMIVAKRCQAAGATHGIRLATIRTIDLIQMDPRANRVIVVNRPVKTYPSRHKAPDQDIGMPHCMMDMSMPWIDQVE